MKAPDGDGRFHESCLRPMEDLGYPWITQTPGGQTHEICDQGAM
jgi:hypothetical protein